jgi:hypothetical protein
MSKRSGFRIARDITAAADALMERVPCYQTASFHFAGYSTKEFVEF